MEIEKNPWSVKAERYLNVTVYNLMRHDECHCAFQGKEEMKDFAKLLEDDLNAGRVMTTATKEEYKRVIAAINLAAAS